MTATITHKERCYTCGGARVIRYPNDAKGPGHTIAETCTRCVGTGHEMEPADRAAALDALLNPPPPRDYEAEIELRRTLYG